MGTPSNADSDAAAVFVKAMIAEVAGLECPVVQLSVSNDQIVVHYHFDDHSSERDRIPVRFWHSVVASIHTLIDERMTLTNFNPNVIPPLNTVELPLSSLSLLQVRRVEFETVHLHFSFSQDSVTMQLSLRN